VFAAPASRRSQSFSSLNAPKYAAFIKIVFVFKDFTLFLQFRRPMEIPEEVRRRAGTYTRLQNTLNQHGNMKSCYPCKKNCASMVE
jgi:hypothetical protein